MKTAKYLSEEFREHEELYASRIANKDITVSFTDGDYSYTTGKTILVNPKLDNLYKNADALYETECELNMTHTFSESPVKAAMLIAHLQIIHEALHARYSDIPARTLTDQNACDGLTLMVINIIYEIIEDAFIENVGCTKGRLIESYLKFYRLLLKNANLSNKIIFEKIDELETEKQKDIDIDLIRQFLALMAITILYPMIEVEMPDTLRHYLSRTLEIAALATTTSNSARRYEYCRDIFYVIEELLRGAPEDASGGGTYSDEYNSENQRQTTTNDTDNSSEQLRDSISRIMGKSRTHVDSPLGDRQQKNQPEEGRPERMLFEEHEDSYRGASAAEMLDDLSKEQDDSESNSEKSNAMVYGCSSAHDGIGINNICISTGNKYKKQYNSIYEKNRGIINNYRARIHEYLHAEVDAIQNKCIIGAGIDSKHMMDSKGRIWYKKYTEQDVPNLAVIIMVDCSGSMEGKRMDSVRKAMVILNEVLKGQEIEYAVFGHTALDSRPWVEHYIVMDYKSKDKDKYNLMSLDDHHGSREGVSLMWANHYLRQNTLSENKLLISISDGEPIHYLYDKRCCVPPKSINDAKDAVKRIEKTGTKVVAIALDDNDNPCYDQLKHIYSNVVCCTKLSKLPKDLLELISKQLAR